MRFPLAGNGGVKRALELAISVGRLPHAIIIEGESGSGKSVLSRFLAAALLCNEEGSPCNNCRACSLVGAGTHPDLFLTQLEDKKKNISVEQIRKLRNEAYIRPQMSDRKVFIIESADTMNPQSQNAILKVLEEPPGDTVFILNVRSRAALLPTIISRCVTYTLCDPEIDEAAEYISHAHQISKDEATQLLKENSNRIGRAVAALNSKKSGIYQMAVDYLDAADNGTLYELIAITASLEKDRVKTSEFFSHMSFLLLSRIKNSALLLKSNKRDFYMYNICRQAQAALQSNVNLPLLFCLTASKIKSKIV